MYPINRQHIYDTPSRPSPLTLSLLVACYNREPFVREAVASAVGQTCADIEIVALDDGSTDGTWGLLRELAEQHSRLKIFQNAGNRGVGYTKRRLIELSSGGLFGFLDPDDALRPDAVEIMVREHLAHPQWGTVHSRQENCDEHLNPLGTYKGKPLQPGQTLLERGGSLSHFCVFKRSYYNQTAGMGAHFRLAEDIDLYLKMEEVGGIGFVDQPLYLWRNHAGGIFQGCADNRALFWTALARYEACVRRGINPEKLLLPELQREFGQIGVAGALKEICREANRILRGKVRGLRKRVGGWGLGARG